MRSFEHSKPYVVAGSCAVGLHRVCRLLSIAFSLPTLPLADLAYRGCDGILGSLTVDISVWCCSESWLTPITFHMKYIATGLAVLCLVVPELILRRYNVIHHFEPRRMWNRLRFRLHFSWMSLYFMYACLALLQTTQHIKCGDNHGDLGWNWNALPFPVDVMLLSCFPKAIRSPAGYIGLCAVVSCVSSSLWLVTCSFMYMVGASKLPRDPTDDGIDEFVWMFIIGMVNYYRAAETVSQIVPFLIVRVLTHFITSHVFKTMKPIIRRPLSLSSPTELHEFDLIVDSQASDIVVSKFTQTRAFIILIMLTVLPGYIALEIYELTNDFQLAVWSTFPAWTIYGRAARCMTKFYVFSSRRWQNVKFFNLTYENRDIAKVGGKLIDLLVLSLIFINIAMGFIESETGSLLDCTMLIGWMFLIVGYRLHACARAVSSVRSQRAALNLASEGDPQISDVCQICSGDIDTNSYWQNDEELDGKMAINQSSISSTVIDSWAPRVTVCGHVFHRQCIRSWVMHRVPNCPVCGRWLKTTKYKGKQRFNI